MFNGLVPSHRLPRRIIRTHWLLFLFFCFISLPVLSVQADTLVPLYIQKGTNLIHITRDYCRNTADWKTIARINHLTSPYIIYANRTIQIPFSLLRLESLSAKVLSLSGSALLVTEDRQVRALKKNDVVFPGQTIKTEADGQVQLMYPDRKYTIIRPDSALTLSYLIRLTDGKIKAEILLDKGEVKQLIKQHLQPNETFETKTPVSITGVRGTEFRLKASDSETNIVETLTGEVSLAAAGKQRIVHEGKGSRVKKGRPPEPPRNLPATPGASEIASLYRTLPIIFQAPSNAAVASIRLRVTTDEEGREILLEQLVQPGEMFTIPFLADDSYFAHLTAVDKENFESIPTQPFPFRLRTIPSAPLISNPKPNLNTWEKSIEISWLKSTLAHHYTLQIATDEQFNNLLVEQQVTDPVYNTPEFEPGTYFFRVQTVAKDGFETLFSQPLSWKVVEQPSFDKMATPEADGSITLQWPSLGDTITYDLQIAEDKNFSKFFLNEEGLAQSAYTITGYIPSGEYFVRMRIVTKDGIAGNWTPSQIMTIEPEPLGLKHLFIALAFIGLILL